MLDEKQFQKRISDTAIDIFPIDRILPIETVFSFFSQEYTKTNDRNLFFRDRKFQRLREGYFAMFIALSLNETSGNKHFLMFPSAKDKDVYILYPKGEKFGAYIFDVKEFTNFTESFSVFVEKSIIPKIDFYNLIIATYRKIDNDDLSFLVSVFKKKDINAKIWIVSAPTEDNDDNEISKVTVINKEGVLYDKNINLNDWIDKYKTPIVYQDVVRIV